MSEQQLTLDQLQRLADFAAAPLSPEMQAAIKQAQINVARSMRISHWKAVSFRNAGIPSSYEGGFSYPKPNGQHIDKQKAIVADGATFTESAPPAKHPNFQDLILQGLLGLGDRASSGDYYATNLLVDAAVLAIRLIQQSPAEMDICDEALEWPQLVPGGPISGPLFKGWLKDWETLGVGKYAPLPVKGSGHFEQGKPAALAWQCYKAMLPVWKEGSAVTPQWLKDARHELLNEQQRAMEADDSPLPENPTWQDETRELPQLTRATVSAWRDVAVRMMEEIQPDWRHWLASLPGYVESPGGVMKRKQTSGHRSPEISAIHQASIEADEAAAKGVVKEALRVGFATLERNLSNPKV